jgi:hypothetical protein
MRLGPFARLLLVLAAVFATYAAAVRILDIRPPAGHVVRPIASSVVVGLIFLGAFAAVFGSVRIVGRYLLRPPVSRTRRTAGAIIAIAAAIGALLATEAIIAWLDGRHFGHSDDLALAMLLLILAVPLTIATELVGWIRERRSKVIPRPPTDPGGPTSPATPDSP